MNIETMCTQSCGGDSYRRLLSLPTRPKRASVRRVLFVSRGSGREPPTQEKKAPPRLTYENHGIKFGQGVERVLQSLPKEMTYKLDGDDATLPSPDIDLDPIAYGKALCSLLDIPVCKTEGGLLGSIHIMMMAYSALTAKNDTGGAEEDVLGGCC